MTNKWGKFLPGVVAAFIVGVLVVGATVAGATTNRGAPIPTKTFNDGIVSFTYPAAWSASGPGVASSFDEPLTYVANVPLGRECVANRDGSVTCGPPITPLPPSGVFIDWHEYHFLNVHLSDMPGHRHNFGAIAGRLLVKHHAQFAGVNCDVLVSAVLLRASSPSFDDLVRVDACFMNPKAGAIQHEVMQMLRSVRLTAPGQA